MFRDMKTVHSASAFVFVLSTILVAVQGQTCGSHGETYPNLARRWKTVVNNGGKIISWRFRQNNGKFVIILRGPPDHQIKRGVVMYEGNPAIVRSNQGRFARFQINPSQIPSEASCCNTKPVIVIKNAKACQNGGNCFQHRNKVIEPLTECSSDPTTPPPAPTTATPTSPVCPPVLDHTTAAAAEVTDWNGPPPGDTVSIYTGVEASGQFLAVGVQFVEGTAPGPDPSLPDSVYIYKRDGDSWELEQKITGPRRWGGRVALSGNLLVVGFENNLHTWRRVAGTWQFEGPTASPMGEDQLGNLGRRIAMDSGIVAAASNLGGAVVQIWRRASGAWVPESSIAGYAQAVDVMGKYVVAGIGDEIHMQVLEGGVWVTLNVFQGIPVSSLALHKQGGKLYLAVGSPQSSNLGGAFVLEWTGTDWVEVQELIPTVNRGTRYGFSIDMTSDGVAVGDPSANSESIFIFKKRDGPTWEYVQKLVDEPFDKLYADSVSMLGDTVFGGGAYKNPSGDFAATNAYTICDE